MLDRITLTDFRNHIGTALDGTARFNLLVGENGAGKTNVLEALSLLTPGRGLRRATLPDMVRSGGGGGFAVGASLDTGRGEPVRLGTYVRAERPTRRLVRINESEASALALGEWLSVSWLTPAMDRLFTDGAGARRRMLDRMTLALDPSHAATATRYEAALRERNRLLTDAAEAGRPPDPSWLDGIEAQLAQHGARLAAGRAATVDALQARLQQEPEEPFARPALAYVPGGPIAADDLAAALRDQRGRDLAARRSLTGPHRDELGVTLTAKDMPAANCSTGEQKALLIAITLAHAQLAAAGRASVLLLDEVAAHLDPVRREAMFARLRDGGSQVWLTGTEQAPFAAIAQEAAVWEVVDGMPRRC